MNIPSVKWLILLPVFLSLAVHLNVLGNGFGWDDESTIESLNAAASWRNILLPDFQNVSASKSIGYYYRPVISTSYLIDYKLWGERPFGFHLSVLIFHVINTGLVYLLARRLLFVEARGSAVAEPEGRPGSGRNTLRPYIFLPLIAASLFAVHPIHAEAVAWIAGRSDVLCTTLALASFLLYVRHRQAPNQWIFVSSMFFFFLALLAKETAAGLILVFPAYDFLAGERRVIRDSDGAATGSWRRTLAYWAAPVVLLSVYFALRTSRIMMPPGHFATRELFSNSSVLEGMASAGLYLKMMIFPYPHLPFIAVLPDSFLFMAVSFAAWVLFGLGLVIAAARRHIPAGIGLVWILAMLAPAVAIGFLRITPTAAAERYVYSPSVGLAILSAWLMHWGYRRLLSSRVRMMAIAGLILMMAIGGMTSWKRHGVWKTPLVFWKTAAAASPEAGQPRVWIGSHLVREGRLAEAEREYREAIRIDEGTLGPNHPIVAHDVYTLGTFYAGLGRYEEAVPLLSRSLSLLERAWGEEHPSVIINLIELASVRHRQRQWEEAETFYRRALTLRERTLGPEHPGVALVLNNLAVMLRAQGRDDEAEPLYRRALAVREKAFGPDHPKVALSIHNLGAVLAARGEYEEAEDAYRRALEIMGRTQGPRRSDTEQMAKNYAAMLMIIGREEEALQLEREWGIER